MATGAESTPRPGMPRASGFTWRGEAGEGAAFTPCFSPQGPGALPPPHGSVHRAPGLAAAPGREPRAPQRVPSQRQEGAGRAERKEPVLAKQQGEFGENAGSCPDV